MIEKIKNDKEYYNIVKEIIESSEFQKRKKFKHHNDSVFEHSIKVSYKSYKIAKLFKINYKNCAIAGLLHDFYKKPWQDNQEKMPFFKQHGFTHANEASINAQKFYNDYMNKIIINSIKRHMFPLNICPPKYIEGWIITLSDKIVSLDVLKNPLSLYRYVGIKNNSNFINYSKKFYLYSIVILYNIV